MHRPAGPGELTVNGLDAINAQGAAASGRIVWYMDWLRFDASGGRVRKLSVTDTGTGMTAEQLHRYINQLASSGREQSAAGNFGVGAKVAAGSRNPHGLEYRSWHQGQGSLVCFKRHPDGRWGLEPQRWPDGHTDYSRPLSEADKPWLLRGQDHGTQVVLLGEHERHDTTQAPPSVTDARNHLDQPLPQRPVPAPPNKDRDPRPRATRPPAARTAATRPRRATPPRATCPRRRRRAAKRRARLLVGARQRSSRPPARSDALGLDRSRRRRARRRALRRATADPRRIRPPTGLRHPLRLRARRTPPPAPGPHRPPRVQHRPHAPALGPRAAPVGPLGRGVHRRDARRDPPTPGTRRHRRRRPAPAGDPPARQRDHAALPPQSLPPHTTAAATRHRVGSQWRRRWAYR